MTVASVKVVGMVAGHREHVVAHVTTLDPVLLVPQPDNPYDPNAVAVYVAPRHALIDLDDLTSSLRDPDGVGRISDADRALLMDRQAGYIPRAFAATVRLPERGIVGYVSEVRWAPLEYDDNGRPLPQRVAGFDVTARWPRVSDDPEMDADLDGWETDADLAAKQTMEGQG
jgi:hypothetical protein